MNQRNKGNDFERKCVSMLAKVLELEPLSRDNVSTYEISSTRFASKELDYKKIDIYIDPKSSFSNMAIQCKKALHRTAGEHRVELIHLHEVYELSPHMIPMLFNLVTKKAKKNEMTVGMYATMYKDHFFNLFKEIPYKYSLIEVECEDKWKHKKIPIYLVGKKKTNIKYIQETTLLKESKSTKYITIYLDHFLKLLKHEKERRENK